MGLLRAEIMELIPLIKRYENPSILMLGKQDIYMEKSDLENLIRLFGYDIPAISQLPSNQDIDSFQLFKMLGATIHALDYSDYEGADIIFDLNSCNLSDDLIEKFDIIIDGGVLEHIFLPGNALNNISQMVKMGG